MPPATRNTTTEAEEEKRQEDLRRVKDELTTCLEDEDCKGAAATKENVVALTATIARGALAKHAEKEAGEEEEKRQADLRRVKDQLKKCLEDEDYTGALHS